MNTFYTILLIIILILLISDVFFLWKIYKAISRKKKYIPDERYFELKYNINLLKAVSAILIFLIGFLGFSTYSNITDNLDSNFTEKFEEQNKRIDSLTTKLTGYEIFIDSLKIEESETVENLDDINRKFKSINKKLSENQESLKYTTKVYVVKNLKFPFDKFGVDKESTMIIYFKNLKTINNDKLPKFKTVPLVVLQGRTLHLDIVELTENYIRIGSTSGSAYYEDEQGFDYFDIWIAEPN